jgi:hypothetical protein
MPIHIYKKKNGVWRRYRANPFRHNIEMGYYDAKGFHPIRKSRDYDPDRVDELYRYGKRGEERSRPRKRRRKGTRARARTHRRTSRRRRTTRRKR